MFFTKEISAVREKVINAISIDSIVRQIINVENYHQFVPWCKRVEIIEKGQKTDRHYFIADLELEIIGIKYTYRSNTEYFYDDDKAFILTRSLPDKKIDYMISKWEISKNKSFQKKQPFQKSDQSHFTSNSNKENEILGQNLTWEDNYVENNSIDNMVPNIISLEQSENSLTYKKRKNSAFIVKYSVNLKVKDLILDPVVRTMMPMVMNKILSSFIDQIVAYS